ncbi:hypothetical protein E2C01_068678 [Portunus trituberculatus]|uniref:Uncharacterized protein n=1 Tax=Portunus trituberculatus TaxID=210409 RepID=A0A5B7HN01_PORTR|nr:hypothetical protein [Portunus trituberculatus]
MVTSAWGRKCANTAHPVLTRSAGQHPNGTGIPILCLICALPPPSPP